MWRRKQPNYFPNEEEEQEDGFVGEECATLIETVHKPEEEPLTESMNTTANTDLSSSTSDEGEIVATPSETEQEDGQEEEDDKVLRAGDHIFVWQNFGVLKAYQKHGVVLSVGSEEADSSSSITVVSFYNKKDEQNVALNDVSTGEDEADGSFLLAENNDGQDGRTTHRLTNRMAVQEESLSSFCKGAEPHKVRYKATFMKRILSRGGTVTMVEPDPRELVVARIRYLLANPHVIPEHHTLSSNGECAAVWCRTGRWCTLQGASILEITCAGQAGSAVVAGGIVSQLWVWAPMPGLYGFYGWMWYVPATMAYPILVPLLVTYGLASLVPLEMLRRFRKKWKSISDSMNHEFWIQADEDTRNEYFGRNASSDQDQMQSFFGIDPNREEDDDDSGGRYMPLSANNDDDDDDLLDDQQFLSDHDQSTSAVNNTSHNEELNYTGKPFEKQQSFPFKKQVSGLLAKWKEFQSKKADITLKEDEQEQFLDENKLS